MWKPASTVQQRVEYVVVWEFKIKPGFEAEFMARYGPDGAWARLFRKSDGYIRTELLRDVVQERRFLTLDYWKSEEEYSTFHKDYRTDYDRLDKELERLTDDERRLGVF